MNILQTLQQLRDDLKLWVTNNLNALNAKIDEKTIPIDNELSTTSTNPVQNQAVATAMNDINNRIGDSSVADQISNAIAAQPHFSGDYNDLTNVPSIFDDGDGEMVVTDNDGNVIFKVDAAGIHSTDLYLNGENVLNVVSSHAEDNDVHVSLDDKNTWNNKVDKVEGKNLSTNDFTDEDKAKLDALDPNATAIDVDMELSETSENPVQNKVINAAIQELNDLVGDSSVSSQIATAINAQYHFSGDYNDLTNAPSIFENDPDILTITDNEGNVIFQVDADGAHTTALTVDGQEITSVIDQKVASLVDSAPEALDTLSELAEALGNDANFSTTVLESLANKVDKIEGKGLSTNDYTTEDKNKLNNVASLVGDTAVSTQISSAVATKADAEHTHDYALIANGQYTATAASTDGIAYTATVPSVSTLTVGASFIMIPGKTSASMTPTLNVNGLGAKNIKRRLSNLVAGSQNGPTNTWLTMNFPYRLTYDGACWVVENMPKPNASDLYGTVAAATKATQDGDGNVITDTYATKTEVSALVGDTPVSEQISAATTNLVSKDEMVQSDWKQNNTEASDYIKNRPFYENIISSTKVYGTAASGVYFTDGVMSYEVRPCSVPMTQGKTYILTCNGIDYEYVAYGYENSSDAYIGNPAIDFDTTSEGDDCPVAVVYAASIDGVMLGAIAEGTYVIEVREVEKEIHKIDERYLPGNSEPWIFTLEDGTTVTKNVVVS